MNNIATVDFSQYKFLFPEFDGYAGFMLLNTIIRAIIPLAMWRTWNILVGYQKDHRAPYAGVSRVSNDAMRSSRTIQDNLKRFEDMNLMQRTVVKVDSVKGKQLQSSILATGKDFQNLYKLAHLYHQWKQSPYYIEPLRENADAIRANPDIYKLVSQFECYRKILFHKKPGPQSKNKEEFCFDNSEVQDGQDILQVPENSKTKEYLVIPSPYEFESISNYDSILNSSETQLEQKTLIDSTPTPISSYSHPPIEKPEPLKEIPPACAKQVEEEIKPSEEFLQEQAKKAQRKKENQELMKQAEPIRGVVQTIMEKLNDQGGRSTLVVMAKLYRRSTMPAPQFIELMDNVCSHVVKVSAARIKVRDMAGRPNRMPLFIKLVEKVIKEGLQVLEKHDTANSPTGNENDPIFDRPPESYLQFEQELSELPSVNPDLDWHRAKQDIVCVAGDYAFIVGPVIDPCERCGCRVEHGNGRCIVCDPPHGLPVAVRRKIGEIISEKAMIC